MDNNADFIMIFPTHFKTIHEKLMIELLRHSSMTLKTTKRQQVKHKYPSTLSLRVI